MKKRLIFLLICVISTVFTSFAQRNLEVKDVSSGLNVFSGKDTEAGMVISCPANISLTFESSHDKVVDVYNTEQKGEEMYYYLRFQTGKRYRGRKLIIRKHSDKCTFYTLRFDCSFAAANTIKPQLL